MTETAGDSERRPGSDASDVLGGPDRAVDEDELGGPDQAEHEDELGGDQAGHEDELGGPGSA